jgi:hypothetical protein
MDAVDVNAQYSIFGSPVRVVTGDAHMLVLHAPHRLGPGRSVSIRSGSRSFQATVASAHVVSLDAESGATYELCVELAGSPAVEPESLKKGGQGRAA